MNENGGRRIRRDEGLEPVRCGEWVVDLSQSMYIILDLNHRKIIGMEIPTFSTVMSVPSFVSQSWRGSSLGVLDDARRERG